MSERKLKFWVVTSHFFRNPYFPFHSTTLTENDLKWLPLPVTEIFYSEKKDEYFCFYITKSVDEAKDYYQYTVNLLTKTEETKNKKKYPFIPCGGEVVEHSFPSYHAAYEFGKKYAKRFGFTLKIEYEFDRTL